MISNYENEFRLTAIAEDPNISNVLIYTFHAVRASQTKGPTTAPLMIRDEPGKYQLGGIYRFEITAWPALGRDRHTTIPGNSQNNVF